MAIPVYVYGAEQICPSCIQFPSSKETASWLSSALQRKYGQQVEVRYVDIYAPQGHEEKRFAERVLLEDMWYPVVVIQGEIVGEGNPKLKTIYDKLENIGIKPLE